MKRHRNTPFSLFSFQDIITGLCGILIFFVLIMLVDLVMQTEASKRTTDCTVLHTEQPNHLIKEIETLRKRLQDLRAKTRQLILSQAETLAPEEEARLKRQITEHEQTTIALKSQLEALKLKLKQAEDTDAENKRRLREMEETRRRLEEKLATLKDVTTITLIPERGEIKAPIYIILSADGYDFLRPFGQSPYRRHYARERFNQLLVQELQGLDHTTHTVILLIRPSGLPMMRETFKRITALGFTCGRDPLEETVELRLPTDIQEFP